MGKDKTIAAFFAGIGGIEEGFHRENAKTVFFCEKDERAKAVLAKHYPGVPIADDISTVTTIPKVDIITAGFPCQDLSQAGLKKGIEGKQSGLVQHLFRILNGMKANAYLKHLKPLAGCLRRIYLKILMFNWTRSVF